MKLIAYSNTINHHNLLPYKTISPRQEERVRQGQKDIHRQKGGKARGSANRLIINQAML